MSPAMLKYFPRNFFFGLVLLSHLFVQAQPAPTTAAERLKKIDQRAALVKRSTINNTAFRNIGPTVMSGRVTDIEVNPNDFTEFYVAYASGGLWHTTNNGLSFNSIFDSVDVLTIGDIAVNWKNRQIWVGTGEVNSSRSSYSGLGIYRSSNNGKSWEWLGLPASHHIGEIVLHPNDPNTAYVAVMGGLYSANPERGVYKTMDGGKNWERILYIDDNTGAVELEIDLSDPNTVYAATWYRTRTAWNFEEGGKTSGIYKTTDGGKNWKQLNTPGSGFPNNEHVGRIGLALYPKDPKIIYALLDNQAARPDTAKKDTSTYQLEQLKDLDQEAFAKLDNNKLDTLLLRARLTPRFSAAKLKEAVAKGIYKPTVLYDYLNINTGFEATPIGAEVYRSDDGGMSWKKTNEKEIPIYFTYGYFFGKIYVSPSNPDKVVALGVTPRLSTDGGKTWKNMDKPNVHADHHALWINPNRDSHMINGNDGGVNITYDDGEHWFKANTPSVGQFYAITVDNAKPYHVYGGLQDNGTWYLPSQLPRNSFSGSGLGQSDGWEKNIGGGDGMQVQVDTRDNVTTYYGSQFGNYLRTNRLTREGTKRITPRHEMGEFPYRYNWQAPIQLSQHNQDVVYFGSNHFHRSLNQGDTMIRMSGDLTNGRMEGNVPYGTLTSISESPLRFGMVYAGTDDGNLFLTRDGGYNWEALHQQPGKKKGTVTGLDTRKMWVSRVIASRYDVNRVYVTLNGYRNDHFNAWVYMSDDMGKTWKQIGTDLPHEPVNVIREDHKNPDILYVGTDGGLYVSLDRGKSFMAWNKGLPRSVPIHDIAIHERENEIILGTHGRSIYVASLKEVNRKGD